MSVTGLTRQLVGQFHGIRGEIVYHLARGVPANSFVLHLPEGRDLLSTRHGFMKAAVICNCQIPEPLWDFMHDQSRDWKRCFKEILKDILTEYDLSLDEVAFLSTGINMENIVWAEEVYEDLWVMVFTTAGVKNNAMRIGRDRASGIERNGQFERIGTINNILLTNASLDPAALAGSFITITEAKNVALQELNIRSTNNTEWLATGTGTDQIVAVSGTGERCTYVGGHTKVGEMMARAVTQSTIDAIKKSSNEHSD